MTKYRKITAQYMNNTLELIVVVTQNFDIHFDMFKSGFDKDLKDGVGVTVPVTYSVFDVEFEQIVVDFKDNEDLKNFIMKSQDTLMRIV